MKPNIKVGHIWEWLCDEWVTPVKMLVLTEPKADYEESNVLFFEALMLDGYTPGVIQTWDVRDISSIKWTRLA